MIFDHFSDIIATHIKFISALRGHSLSLYSKHAESYLYGGLLLILFLQGENSLYTNTEKLQIIIYNVSIPKRG